MNREKISKQIASRNYDDNLYGLMNLLKLEIKNIDHMLSSFNDEDFKEKNLNKFLLSKQRDSMKECLWEVELRMKSENILDKKNPDYKSIPIYTNTLSSVETCKYLINRASKKGMSIDRIDIQTMAYLIQMYGAYYNKVIFADNFVAMDLGICMPSVYFQWCACINNVSNLLSYPEVKIPLCAPLIEAVLDFYDEERNECYGFYEKVIRNDIWENKRKIYRKKVDEIGFNKFDYEPITWEEIKQNAKECSEWINSINFLIEENKRLE